MPSAGLSLVGFLEAVPALEHLKQVCVPSAANGSDADLLIEWANAKARLSPAANNAGKPSISPISNADAHIDNLINNSPRKLQINQNLQMGASFATVEIDSLLAFQFTIDLDRSVHHCGPLTKPPTSEQLFDLCLPINPPPDPLHISVQGQSALLRSRNLGFRIAAQGPLGPNTIGIHFGLSLPLVHVVRYNGRCYLHNGFHRVYGARVAGALQVPCLLRDVNSESEIGLQLGGTFGLPLLESENPPTLGHFTSGEAWHVRLRTAARILQVNWSDHVMFEE